MSNREKTDQHRATRRAFLHGSMRAGASMLAYAAAIGAASAAIGADAKNRNAGGVNNATTSDAPVASDAAKGGTADAGDIATREAFDRLDLAYNAGRGATDKTNEAGALGWGEAYALQSYLLMYRAHRDTKYLDKLIDHADLILKSRDHVRGVADYRGKSLPAWRTAGKYTCGALELKDPQGKSIVLIRSGVRPANQVSIEVAAATIPGKFRLVCTRTAPKKPPVVQTFDNLCMDRECVDYFIKRINGQFEKLNGRAAETADSANSDGGLMITAADLRDPKSPRGEGPALNPIALPATQLAPLPYMYAVQTGMIVYPLAAFARLVAETPELRASAKYQAKAVEYRDAAQQAVDIFDYEWRENTETGEGWLVWSHGCPTPFDGSDQAHNQYLVLGSVMIELAAVAKDADARQRYRDRATKMARTFKNDMKLGQNGALSWTYFWTKGRGYNGWSAKDDVSDYQPTWVTGKTLGHKSVEDSSHAHIDVAFALLAYENKLGVFDEQDMKRLAATFTKNVFTRDGGRATLKDSVDGSGKSGTYENMAAAWAAFAKWDPAILPLIREVYRTKKSPINPPSALFASALLNQAAKLS